MGNRPAKAPLVLRRGLTTLANTGGWPTTIVICDIREYLDSVNGDRFDVASLVRRHRAPGPEEPVRVASRALDFADTLSRLQPPFTSSGRRSSTSGTVRGGPPRRCANSAVASARISHAVKIEHTRLPPCRGHR